MIVFFKSRILTIFLILSGSIGAENISAQNIRLKLQDVPLIDANEGVICPVDVSIDWAKPDHSRSSDDFWIETKMNPVQEFPSSLLNFFMLPEQVLPESGIPPDEQGIRHWIGIYAVPVPRSDSSLPRHELKISILRDEQSFPRFAVTRNEPERREPVSNVAGGIGYVGGISLDSRRIIVE